MNEVNVLNILGCSFRLFPKEYVALLVCTWLLAIALLKEDAKIDIRLSGKYFYRLS